LSGHEAILQKGALRNRGENHAGAKKRSTTAHQVGKKGKEANEVAAKTSNRRSKSSSRRAEKKTNMKIRGIERGGQRIGMILNGNTPTPRILLGE